MCDQLNLEDTASYVPEGEFRVYIGCSLTSDDITGLRDRLLAQVEAVFRESGFLVHNPSSHTKPGSPHHAIEVTAFDHLQAMRCDMIFFIRVQPSLGMGIEAHIAADTLIPWADAKVSKDFLKLTPLLAGLPNPSAGFRLCFDVDDVDGFIVRLRESLKGKDFRERLRNVQRAKSVVNAVIGRIEIGRAIRRQRLLLNMTTVELAELVDLEPWWIRSIESDPSLAECLTFFQLMRLVDATRLRWVLDPLNLQQLVFPRLAPVDSFSSKILQAAEEFTDYCLRPRLLGEPPRDDDEQMLVHWREWLSEYKGIQLPPRPKESAAPVGELTAFLAIPLSNVDTGQGNELRAVVDAIRNALGQIACVTLHIEEPDYVSHARDEHGAEIYLATIRRISRCDFAIVLAQPPATGVGITTRLFANATLPCLAMAEKGNPVSRMFGGMYCRWIDEIVCYVSSDEVSSRVEDALAKHVKALCEAAALRRVVRDQIVGATVSNAVDRFRIPRRMGFEEAVCHLKAVPFIRGEWLDALARDAAMLPTVTLVQFIHIAHQLGWGIGVSSSGVPCLIPSHCDLEERGTYLAGDRYIEAVEESLGNLIDARDIANQELSSPIDDQMLFDEWQEYCRKLSSLGADDLAESRLVRSHSEWLEALMRSQPGAAAAPAGTTSQKFLPGMERCVADNENQPKEGTSAAGDAVLYLLGIAKHGLPTGAIAQVIDQSPETVEGELAAMCEAGAVRSNDGVWTAVSEYNGPQPRNANNLIHRAIASLLASLECDTDAAFSRGLLRSAFLLGKAGRPIPITLAGRLYILQGDHSKAWRMIGEQIRELEDDKSKEYVESLIVLGRAAPTFEQAAGCLDEAVEICDHSLSMSDGRADGWCGLHARARLARGLASKEARQGNPVSDLSKAAKLWELVGNELAHSVAEWHQLLFEDKEQVFKKHQARLERESPVIRVETVRIYKARAASPTQPVLSLRRELTRSQCEQFIREARLKYFGRPTTE